MSKKREAFFTKVGGAFSVHCRPITTAAVGEYPSRIAAKPPTLYPPPPNPLRSVITLYSPRPPTPHPAHPAPPALEPTEPPSAAKTPPAHPHPPYRSSSSRSPLLFSYPAGRLFSRPPSAPAGENRAPPPVPRLNPHLLKLSLSSPYPRVNRTALRSPPDLTPCTRGTRPINPCRLPLFSLPAEPAPSTTTSSRTPPPPAPARARRPFLLPQGKRKKNHPPALIALCNECTMQALHSATSTRGTHTTTSNTHHQEAGENKDRSEPPYRG